MDKLKYNIDLKIDRLFQQSGSTLQLLTRKAALINQLQTQLRNCVEPACRQHCWLASIQNGYLLLHADNSAWATRIRFQQRNILQQLKGKKGFGGLRGIKVKVQPRYTPPPIVKQALPLTASSRACLHECAEAIDDPKLKAALEKLGQH